MPLGASWGSLGASWGLSWDSVGPFGGPLGALLGPLGASWGLLGLLLGAPLVGDTNLIDFGSPLGAQGSAQRHPKSNPKRIKIKHDFEHRKSTSPRPSWGRLGAILERFRSHIREQKPWKTIGFSLVFSKFVFLHKKHRKSRPGPNLEPILVPKRPKWEPKRHPKRVPKTIKKMFKTRSDFWGSQGPPRVQGTTSGEGILVLFGAGGNLKEGGNSSLTADPRTTRQPTCWQLIL